jgi:hypothetical protein
MTEKTSTQANRQSVSALTNFPLTDQWQRCARLTTAVTGLYRVLAHMKPIMYASEVKTDKNYTEFSALQDT